MAEEKGKIRAVAPSTAETSAGSAALDAEAVACLSRLVQDVGSSLELDQVLSNVASAMKQHSDYDTFAVLLLDDLGQQLKFRFAVGFDEEVQRNWSFGLGQGIVGTAAMTRRALRVDDVRHDKRYIGAAPEVRSELAIPLKIKGRTIGVLDVGSKTPGHFTQEHETLLQFVADQLATGIENARLYENVRAQAQSLSVLHEVSRELTSLLDRKKLLRKVAEMVKRLIDYQLFSVMLWNPETQLLDHTFALRFDERFVEKGGYPLGHGVTGTVAALRQPMRVPNVHLSPHYTDCGHGLEVRSELAVPLVFKDELIGVLDIESTEYNAFTAQDEQMLSTLGSYVAVALDNARLYAKVAENEHRLERDLETAREIQRGLLHDGIPEIAGVDVAYAYQMAHELGGDFYDFLPYGDNRLAIAVGDASGKGTAAALHGSLAIGILRGHVVEHPCYPAEMLAELNVHLQQARLANRFVAMTFGIYDGRDRSLTIANAGFTRPLLVRDGRAEDLSVEGVPLGLLPDSSYEEKRFELRSGDTVILTSDGVNESTDRSCEEFGARRLRHLAVKLAHRPAQELADELLRSTARHEQGACNVQDDRTVVVLKVL